MEEAGRIDVPGHPIGYQTTPLFLRAFGLESLEDLPEPRRKKEETFTGELEGYAESGDAPQDADTLQDADAPADTPDASAEDAPPDGDPPSDPA